MADARIIMIRFNEPKRFDELTTSTLLPVRFIFIIVGPSIPDVDYHELGRTVATFMSNKIFSDVATTAVRRDQLLAAIDDFLDLSIIVPPGDIDSRALLTVDDVRKALKQRKRAKAALADKERAEKGNRPMSFGSSTFRDPVLHSSNFAIGAAAATSQRHLRSLVAAHVRSSGSVKISLLHAAAHFLLGLETLGVAGPVVVAPDQKAMKQMELETEVVQGHGRVDHVKDSLRRTGRPFGGVIDDIKYRLPFYFRDYKDALNFQCVTSALFMFCANFASAVAFGEVMGKSISAEIVEEPPKLRFR